MGFVHGFHLISEAKDREGERKRWKEGERERVKGRKRGIERYREQERGGYREISNILFGYH